MQSTLRAVPAKGTCPNTVRPDHCVEMFRIVASAAWAVSLLRINIGKAQRQVSESRNRSSDDVAGKETLHFEMRVLPPLHQAASLAVFEKRGFGHQRKGAEQCAIDERQCPRNLFQPFAWSQPFGKRGQVSFLRTLGVLCYLDATSETHLSGGNGFSLFESFGCAIDAVRKRRRL